NGKIITSGKIATGQRISIKMKNAQDASALQEVYEIKTIIRGDINQNSVIDAADYLMVMDSIIGKYKMSEIQKIIGDVNKNGSIDAADYLMIMDSIIGKIKL
ncbi:MAG: dockerin type I repeat-containing protein, partial [Erysipelotrichaceae bacterium]